MKTTITEVAITLEGKNPIYESMVVRVMDEAAGSFLKLIGENASNDGNYLLIDWEEWDAIVEVVAKYRKQWDWDEEGKPVLSEKEGIISDKEDEDNAIIDWMKDEAQNSSAVRDSTVKKSFTVRDTTNQIKL